MLALKCYTGYVFHVAINGCVGKHIALGGKVSKREENNLCMAEVVRPGDDDLAMQADRLAMRGENGLLYLPQFDLLPDPVLIFEVLPEKQVAGKVLYANKAFLDRLEYDAETLALTPPRILHHETRHEVFAEGVRDLCSLGGMTVETRMVTSSGRDLSMEAHVRMVSIGGFTASLGVYRDLTRRKMIETALMDVRANYRRLFDQAVQGVFQSTLEGRFIKANPAMIRMLGYASAEEMMLSIKDMSTELYYCPEDRVRYLGILSENGRVERFETRFKRKDGSLIWVSLSTRLVSGESALDSFIEGLCVDITERKLTEAALRESEELHRVLLMSLSDAVCITDEDGRFTYISPNVELLFGMAPDEIGRLGNIKALLGGLLVDSRQLDQRGEVFNMEVEVPGGPRPRTLLVSVKQVNISGGTRLYACRDVTEMRELQTEAMRAAHLASLGELAAGVAHEINNPINAIVLWADYLREEAPDLGDAAEAPDRILKQGERVAAIVRNLLSFSRTPESDPGPVDIREILEDSLGLTRARMDKDGITLEIYIKTPPPRVCARDQEVQQVFVNLLSNARDALNERYPERHPAKRLAISVRTVERETGLFVRASFTDFGIGIPAKERERIFDPFYSTKPKHQGTGLGLSTTHRILRDLGGRLALYSEANSYTRAVVEFPVWVEESAEK